MNNSKTAAVERKEQMGMDDQILVEEQTVVVGAVVVVISPSKVVVEVSSIGAEQSQVPIMETSMVSKNICIPTNLNKFNVLSELEEEGEILEKEDTIISLLNDKGEENVHSPVGLYGLNMEPDKKEESSSCV
ncbi:hypothetical protein MA16_Dca006833 [Dendrobium catenatum]|uniref:Uncharacterized protein n=1 Tax=Dendrobium catenatum TaxID=906689 RepID=A0A2I0VSW9_9ASPA|nr:hypothetical protein MA16_Dca006833 [Dendrobium catenatum]